MDRSHHNRVQILLSSIAIWAALIIFSLTFYVYSASAEEQSQAADKESYLIQELLKTKCFDCHGVDRQKSGLRLDDRPSALKGGNSGVAAITPNDPLASTIVQRITLPMEDSRSMPPPGTDRPRLTAEESIQIIHWIHRGAEWPSFRDFEEDQSTSTTSVTSDNNNEDKIESIVGDLVSFDDQILPIFQKNCITCHGPDEQIKGLRLDTAVNIVEANFDNSLLVAGNPEDSELFRRLTLPEDDYEVMPPSNFGPPLSAEDQELVRLWISQGIKFKQSEEMQIEKNQIIEQVIPPADRNSLANLAQMGALAAPIAQDTNFIQIDFGQIADEIGDNQLSYLESFKEQLRWLDIGGTKITDSGLEKLVDFPNLTRLHLENTNVGDIGLSHLPALKNLVYLNLFNTQVGDASIEHLKLLEKLEQVYLWKTQISEVAAEKLMIERPDLTVNLGWEYELKKKLLIHLEEPVEKAVQLSTVGAIEALVNLVSKDDLETARRLVESAVEKQNFLEEKAKTENESKDEATD